MLTDFLYAASQRDFDTVLDALPYAPFIHSDEHARAMLHLISDDVRHVRYRAYDLDRAVFDLADGMVRHQWGKPLPYTRFDDTVSTIFGATIGGTGVVLCAVPMSDMGQGLLLGTNNSLGRGEAVMARQIADGKLSVVYADRQDSIAALTDLTALCAVALQLIEGRHVSTQPRTAKRREKIKGKVTKHRAPYTFTYIDVNRDVAAHNTTGAHGNGHGSCVRFHHVRQHLRLTNGKVVSVKAHFRGKGAPRSVKVTRVTALQNKPEA